MTDFHESIRSRMGDGPTTPDVEQMVSGGLFGIADADVFTSLVQKVFPAARVGGSTSESIEGAVYRIGTGNTTVYRDEIEELLDVLGEKRVAQNVWSVEAVEWVEPNEINSADAAQRVTVQTVGLERILNGIGDRFSPIYRDGLVDRGYTDGAATPPFSEGEVGDITVRPLSGEVVVTVQKNSVDSSAVNALGARVRDAITRIASASDPLSLPVDKRIEMDQAIMDDFEITGYKMEVV